jgi:hypothetical protein
MMRSSKANVNNLIGLGGSQATLHHGLIFSLLGHLLLALGLIWVKGFMPSGGPMMIAAGAGEGDSGGAIEVGVVGASEWLRFYPEFDVATLGDDRFDVATLGDDRTAPPTTEVLSQQPEMGGSSTGSLPGLRSKTEDASPTASTTTNRPVAPTPDKPYTREKSSGGTASSGALVGIPGSPFPGDVRGGVGIGGSGGIGGLAGIPGGSEYGRRLQSALSGYYRLTPTDFNQDRFVIVRVRIDRSGRVRSLEGGRLHPDAYIRTSGNIVIDSRVVGALLELDRHPIPFPPGFLPSAQEAVVEMYFQY